MHKVSFTTLHASHCRCVGFSSHRSHTDSTATKGNASMHSSCNVKNDNNVYTVGTCRLKIFFLRTPVHSFQLLTCSFLRTRTTKDTAYCTVRYSKHAHLTPFLHRGSNAGPPSRCVLRALLVFSNSLSHPFQQASSSCDSYKPGFRSEFDVTLVLACMHNN